MPPSRVQRIIISPTRYGLAIQLARAVLKLINGTSEIRPRLLVELGVRADVADPTIRY